MPALRISLAVIDNASLEDVIEELMSLANVTGREQTVTYNGKWMKAVPDDTSAKVLARYAGEKQVATVQAR